MLDHADHPAEAALAAEDIARVRQAAHPGTPPETLMLLAAHPSALVRGAVALNATTADPTNAILAADQDPRVRLLLARKLAALCPGMGADEHEQLQSAAARLLGQLAMDEAARVRAAIAEVVKDMPEAPRALILRLARDAEFSVCGPVIAMSPLLTPEDLLTLLAEAPGPVRSLAVARRAYLPVSVSDAIAHTTDVPAIAALLANQTAAIRETTLDGLVARAADHPEWHAPLVRRPRLPHRAAAALSKIVVAELLRELAHRSDLPEGMLAEFRARLEARLLVVAPHQVAPTMGEHEAMAAARSLAAQGKLNERSIADAAAHGDKRLAAAMLALAADVPLSAVEHACRLRSPKAMVSLVWKAGFPMQASEPLQTHLARIAPADTLHARPGGHFPLGIDEMRFQLDFLGAPCHAHAHEPARHGHVHGY